MIPAIPHETCDMHCQLPVGDSTVLYMYICTYVLYFNQNAVLTWTHVPSEPNLSYYYNTSAMIYYIIALGII